MRRGKSNARLWAITPRRAQNTGGRASLYANRCGAGICSCFRAPAAWENPKSANLLMTVGDYMSRRITLFTRMCMAALFASFGAAGQAATPLLPVCSWPFEVTGQGVTNVATPDTNATYWVMPLDLNRWRQMVIHGQYPDARFFNFSTYTASGSFIDSLYDAKISPDVGSANRFTEGSPDNPGNYTVTIGATNPGSSNLLSVAGSRFAFVVYRVYLPDVGVDKTGGVGVPAVTLIDFSGSSRTLRPCPFADAEASLGNLILLLEAAGMTDAARFLGQILILANQSPLGTCSPNQAGPTLVSFSAAVPGANFFPNPQTTYFQTANLCFQPDEMLVIRGKAPVFPKTYTPLGGTVSQPAFDGQIQLRYWSMCNNVGVLPYPVVACQADAMTEIDPITQDYTYVISNDPAPPMLPAGVTWLPWGPISLPITLIFRNILPENGFVLTPDYLPIGVFCSRLQFNMRGPQGCFAAAGISAQMP